MISCDITRIGLNCNDGDAVDTSIFIDFYKVPNFGRPFETNALTTREPRKLLFRLLLFIYSNAEL